MSLYPSLEDMKVDQIQKAQLNEVLNSAPNAPHYPYPEFEQTPMPLPTNPSEAQLYPMLRDFMGLELSEAAIAELMPEYSQVAVLQQVF